MISRRRRHIAECECLVFESNGRSRGTFSSINYPAVYPSNIACVLYTLIGDYDEIVEIDFVQFHLQVPFNNRSVSTNEQNNCIGPQTERSKRTLAASGRCWFISRPLLLLIARRDTQAPMLYVFRHETLLLRLLLRYYYYSLLCVKRNNETNE